MNNHVFSYRKDLNFKKLASESLISTRDQSNRSNTPLIRSVNMIKISNNHLRSNSQNENFEVLDFNRKKAKNCKKLKTENENIKKFKDFNKDFVSPYVVSKKSRIGSYSKEKIDLYKIATFFDQLNKKSKELLNQFEQNFIQNKSKIV